MYPVNISSYALNILRLIYLNCDFEDFINNLTDRITEIMLKIKFSS